MLSPLRMNVVRRCAATLLYHGTWPTVDLVCPHIVQLHDMMLRVLGGELSAAGILHVLTARVCCVWLLLLLQISIRTHLS